MSEVEKTRELVLPFMDGNGVDLGSRGDPIVPWAIQFDLHRFHYPPAPPVQFVHDLNFPLPFEDETLDFVYASHVLEDFKEWHGPLSDWGRVLKPGGVMVIQVPHHQRYRAAITSGQPDNKAHKHEALYMEEVWDYLHKLFPTRALKLICQFEPENDYNILTVARFL